MKDDEEKLWQTEKWKETKSYSSVHTVSDTIPYFRSLKPVAPGLNMDESLKNSLPSLK